MSKINVSVILPVINETFSLEKTISIILSDNKKDILEIIIILSKIKTTKNALKKAEALKDKFQDVIKVYFQELPFHLAQYLLNI